MKNKGFTMLELLMVIVVVGLLASFAIPKYEGFVEKARATELVNIVGAIKSAQEVYKLETGVYANSFTSLASSGFNVANTGYWQNWSLSSGSSGAVKYWSIAVYRTSKGGSKYANTNIYYYCYDNNYRYWMANSYPFMPVNS